MELPERMTRLPKDKIGRPVPWFAVWVDGVPDFRVADGRKLRDALKYGLCWVCGCPFAGGERRAFTVGPMCAVNRVSSEPPAHVDCAIWSAENCPFLNTPQMVRRERHVPSGAVNPAGIMIRRNPGVALVWVVRYRDWRVEREGGGILVRFGDPVQALWFAQGREATRDEVLASVGSGLPLLREVAEKNGPDAVAELEQLHREALQHIPAGAAS